MRMRSMLRLFGWLFFAGVCSGCASNNGTPAPPALPTSATAWVVTAGASQSDEAVQALNYYPQAITVDAGEAVVWKFPTGEPHTVTLLGPRTSPPSPSDPTSAAPVGPTTYDGSTYVSSGFVLLGQTYGLIFSKPGTYTYQCLIHPGMHGTIIVQAANAPHPIDPATYAAQGAAQATSDLAAASAAVATFPYAAGGPHLVAGMAPGMAMGMPSPLTILRFLDGPALSDTSVTISAGQAVTWTNQSNNEPHTVTIAPAGAAFPVLAPFAPPSGGNVYDGTTLVNSGVLAPGQSFSLTFTKAGTYTYHCIFHDDTEHMIGTVVVV
jgi:plastocyanin